MIALALIVACATGAPQEASFEAELERGRFGAAWRALEAEPDVRVRRRGQVETLYAAGDPAGVLAFAEAGLALAPGDLELLHRAVSSALWLREPALAAAWNERLAAALGGAALAESDRAAWTSSVAGFRERIASLERAREQREAASLRARLVACAALVACALALVLLAPFRAGRADPCGTSARSGSAG